jgi:hypothetical protein
LQAAAAEVECLPGDACIQCILQHTRSEGIEDKSPLFFPADERGVFEDREVVGEIHRRNAQSLGNLGDVPRALRQIANDLKAFGGRQGRE